MPLHIFNVFRYRVLMKLLVDVGSILEAIWVLFPIIFITICQTWILLIFAVPPMRFSIFWGVEGSTNPLKSGSKSLENHIAKTSRSILGGFFSYVWEIVGPKRDHCGAQFSKKTWLESWCNKNVIFCVAPASAAWALDGLVLRVWTRHWPKAWRIW